MLDRLRLAISKYLKSTILRRDVGIMLVPVLALALTSLSPGHRHITIIRVRVRSTYDPLFRG